MTPIDTYLKNVPSDQKAELERIRTVVKKIVPEVEEVISYGMPVFKYKGKYLIGMSQFKDHLSIFPGSGPVESLAEELAGFKTSKGTVQFTIEKPIPETLLITVIQDCLARI